MKIIKTNVLAILLLSSYIVNAQKSLESVWREALPESWLMFEDLDPINEQQAKVQLEGRWGIADIQGQIIIPAIYDKIHPFPNGRFSFPACFQVSVDGRMFGLIDANGGSLTPFAFNQIEVIEDDRIRACSYAGVCKEFLSTGEEVTPPVLKKFRCRVKRRGGLTPASEDGLLYGLANDNGDWVVLPQYTNIYNDDGPIWIVDGEKGGYKVLLPQNLEWESPIFEWIRCIWSGFAGAMGDGVWHEYDLKGNVIGKTMSEFDYNYYYNQTNTFTFIEKGRRGLMSMDGKVLLPPIYDSISRKKAGGITSYIVGQADGIYGLFQDGEWMLPLAYENILLNEECPLFCAITGDSTLVVDAMGKKLATLPFQVKEQDGDIFIDYLNKQYFWTPNSGLVKLPLGIEKVSRAYDAVILKNYNGKYNLMDLKGREVLAGYDEIQVPYQNEDKHPQYYLIRKNALWGMVDHSFRFGIEPQYNGLIPIGYGRFIARKGLHFGIVNHKNEELLPFEYEEQRALNGFLALRKNKKWMVLDITNNQPVTNLDFDEIGDMRMNYFVGKQEGLFTVFNKEGQKVGEKGYSMQPHFYNEGGFSIGEEGHRAFYSATGVRMTEHEYSGFEYVENRQMGEYVIKAILPKGGNVYYDKNMVEIIRAKDFRIRSNGTLAVMVDKFWQFMDRQARPISNLYLTSLANIPDNRGDAFFAGKDTNGLWHVVDLAGRSVHQFEAEYFRYLGEYDNDMRFYFFRNGQKYRLEIPGFAVKECKFEINQEGLVRLKGKVGYANKFGVLVIPCEYDEIVEPGENRFRESRLLAAKKDGFYSIYDTYSGEKILDGVKAFKKYGWPSRTFYHKNDISGVIQTKSGEVGKATFYKFGHSVVGGKTFYSFSLDKNGRLGLLDRNLQQYLPPVYNSIRAIEAGRLILKDSIGQQALFDGNRLVEINASLNVVCAFKEKLLVRDGEAFWFASYGGKKIKKLSGGELEHKTAIGNGEYALHVKLNGQYYFYFTDGRPSVGPIQKKHLQKSDDYLVEIDGKWGLFNLAVGFLAKPVYDTIEDNKQNGYWTKKGKKWGFTNYGGQALLAPNYDIKPLFNGQYFIVRKNRQFYYLDVFGKSILDSYDYALPFSAGLAPVCRDGKWGYIDKEGKQVTPFQYDYAHPFYDFHKVAWVMIGDSTHFIDLKGNMVSNPPSGVRATDSSWLYDPTLLWPADKQAQTKKIKNNLHYAIFYDTFRKQYGIVSFNGKTILEAEASAADWIERSTAALAWYLKDGKYGFITSKETVIPAEYDKYEIVDIYSLKLYKGQKKYFLQPNGELVPTNW